MPSPAKIRLSQLMKIRRFIVYGRNEYDGSPCVFAFDLEITRNKRGNIVVEIEQYPRYFVPFFKNKKFVFDWFGRCLSHQPSDKYKYHKVNAELKWFPNDN